MPTVGVYFFEAKIVSWGYHVYKETSSSKSQDGKKVKAKIKTSQNSK